MGVSKRICKGGKKESKASTGMVQATEAGMTPERKAAILLSAIYKVNQDVIETEIDKMITFLRGDILKVSEYPEYMAEFLTRKYSLSQDRVLSALRVVFKETT